MTKNKKSRLTAAEKDHIDNQVVIATAVSLGGAMLLMFLYNWIRSTYAAGTITLIYILMYVCIGLVLAAAVVGIVTKDKKWFKFIPYFAVSALIFAMIKFSIISTITGLFGLSFGSATAHRFYVGYVILAVYLVASYVYYGIKLKK